MPRMLYRCSYGTAPGPDGVGRVALYEVTDLAGDHVESGLGDKVRDDPRDALNDALALGRAAIERLQNQTTFP